MPQTPRERELFVSERPVRSDFGRSDFSRSEKSRERIYARRRRITLTVIAAVVAGVIYAATAHHDTAPADIPTIKAEGDYKQKPANPGGIDIPHQDVEIYNKMESKTAEPVGVEHLLPLPETPQDVPHAVAHVEKPAPVAAAVSAPSSGLTPTVDKMVAPVEAPIPDPVESSVVPSSSAVKALPAKAAVAKDAILGGVTNSKPVATTVAPVVAPVAVASVPVVGVTAAAAPTSLIPAVKSADVNAPQTIDDLLKRETGVDTAASAASTKTMTAQTLSARTIPAKAVSTNPAPTNPVPVASSGRVAVQLASVPDQTQAQNLMQSLQQKYASDLGGVTLRLARADLGSRGVYYRIQAQNLSEDSANHICSALKQKNAGCILVRP